MSHTTRANEPLAILVVDDFAPFRDALRHIFDECVFVKVVGEAGDGNAAIEMARRLVPQIILMDVSMPNVGGPEATRRIKLVLPELHVIGLSSQNDSATREAMMAAGCSAFVAKECAHTLLSIITKLTGRHAEVGS
jgi:DNA-binding NarL/FixJ family response regulator